MIYFVLHPTKSCHFRCILGFDSGLVNFFQRSALLLFVHEYLKATCKSTNLRASLTTHVGRLPRPCRGHGVYRKGLLFYYHYYYLLFRDHEGIVELFLRL